MCVCILWVCSADTVITRRHKAPLRPLTLANVHSYWLLRVKGASVLLKYLEVTEQEFFFGASKSIFSGMRRLHHREIVIFAFVHFFFMFIVFLYVIGFFPISYLIIYKIKYNIIYNITYRGSNVLRKIVLFNLFNITVNRCLII